MLNPSSFWASCIQVLSRNMGFLIRNLFFANKKAETHFKQMIEVGKGIGATGLMSQTYFDLGQLYEPKAELGRPGNASRRLSNFLIEQGMANLNPAFVGKLKAISVNRLRFNVN